MARLLLVAACLFGCGPRDPAPPAARPSAAANADAGVAQTLPDARPLETPRTTAQEPPAEDAKPAPAQPPRPGWAVVRAGAESTCVAVEITRVTHDNGAERGLITGNVAGVSFHVRGHPAGDGLIVDSFNLAISHPGGGSGSSAHCGHVLAAAGDPPSPDAHVYEDRAACEEALAAGIESSLGSCVGSAVATLLASVPGRKPPARNDPLLRRMKRKARIWVLEADGCLDWRFVPSSKKDPTRGTIKRKWREADGTRVEYGYDYEYLDRLLTLSGPGGEQTHPDGTTSAYGMGCFEQLQVEHEKGASEIGGQLWHYDKGGCEAERRRVEREEAADTQADDTGDVQTPDRAAGKTEPSRGGLGGC